jgi:hypothetical protein
VERGKYWEAMEKQTLLWACRIRFLNFLVLSIERVLSESTRFKKKAGENAGLSPKTLEMR